MCIRDSNGEEGRDDNRKERGNDHRKKGRDNDRKERGNDYREKRRNNRKSRRREKLQKWNIQSKRKLRAG